MLSIEKEILLILRTGGQDAAEDLIHRLRRTSPDFVTTLRLLGHDNLADEAALKMNKDLGGPSVKILDPILD